MMKRLSRSTSHMKSRGWRISFLPRCLLSKSIMLIWMRSLHKRKAQINHLLTTQRKRTMLSSLNSWNNFPRALKIWMGISLTQKRCHYNKWRPDLKRRIRPTYSMRQPVPNLIARNRRPQPTSQTSSLRKSKTSKRALSMTWGLAFRQSRLTWMSPKKWKKPQS